MKKILIYTAVLAVLLTSTFAHSNLIEKYRDWVVDSYNYGFAGNNCKKILYDYGVQGRPFTSENSQFIKTFYNACELAREDASIGRDSLPQILDDWDSSHGGE